MKRKLAIVSTLLVTTMLSFTACGGGTKTAQETQTQQKQITLKMGHGVAAESEMNTASLQFAKLVDQKSNGKIKVEVYPNGQLGPEEELAEGIRQGTVDMALIATGSVTKYVPEYALFDLPFLFRDTEHADKVLQGDIGKTLKEKADKGGVKVISYWESGFRNFLNSKRPVKSPKDLEGLKIRTPNWPILIAATKALGGNPVPMAFSELYMACQQGVVDGQEGPPLTIKSSKMYEVQKYMVLDGHTYCAMVLLINPKKFSALTPDLQNALIEASNEAGNYERTLIRNSEKDQINFLETTGKLKIEKDINKEEWKNAVKPVYDEYSEKIGKDLIQKIIDTKQTLNFISAYQRG